MARQARGRTDRRKQYRHEGTTDVDVRAVRVARAADNVIVNVHVHNDVGALMNPKAGKGMAQPGVRPPRFRGQLFSWIDHYQPIVTRLAPIVAERENSERGSIRWRRLCLLVALVGAIAAVGCGLL